MIKKLGFFMLTALLSASINASRFDSVTIKPSKVSGDVYILEGSGGNIGLLATDEGLVLIDDQFQPLAEKIEAAMKQIKDAPLKYVVNTHYHGDHTGGNAYFSHKAPIFAHHNVRSRLASKEDANAAELPVVTYNEGVTIHLANETIHLKHYPKGHTDGDTVVYFESANVLHPGDLFFEGRFPYVDLNGGGSVKGYLANIKQVIANLPDDVKIIPGHGKVATKADYQKVVDMMTYSIDRVSSMLAQGKSESDILAAGIGDKYKDWGWRFITEEKWLKTLVTDLSK